MGEMRQPPEERAALERAWQAQPVVQELSEQVEAFAWRNGLSFNAEGLNKALQFASEFVSVQPSWPHSGILVG